MGINRCQILPSVFAANVAQMESEIQKIKESKIEIIHYDVMDNHFVPNISFGPLFIEQMIKATPEIKADIHLMTDLPGHWEAYLELKPYSLSIHLEAGTPELVKNILQKIKAQGILAGLSLKPQTPVSAIKDFIHDIDLLLIMSVEPGFSFQSFIPESVDKIREVRALCGKDIIIEADGGITKNNMAELKEAGLDWFVMGGGFFKEEKRAQLLKDLKAL